MRKCLRTEALLVSMAFLLGGCSLFSSSSVERTQPASTSGMPSGQQSVPFQLKVEDEVNDGERLHVLGSISSSVPWEAKGVIVKLTGLNNGEVSGVSYLPLQKIAAADASRNPAIIQPDQKYSFSLSIPSESITDYQIELLWGQEAAQYLKEVEKARPGSVELRQIEVLTYQENCGITGCEYKHRIEAYLYNASGQSVHRVVLGVGYIRHQPGNELDLSRQIPQNEERVEIANLVLAPGASRPLKLDVERTVKDTALKPTIRIIDFE